MIRLEAFRGQGPEWNELVARFPGLSLLQCWEHGEAKGAEGWHCHRLVARRQDQVLGAVQVMVRPLPLVGGGLAWVSRGPLAADAQGQTDMLTALRHWARRQGLYLRVAPAVAEITHSGGLGGTGRLGWASALLDLAPDEAHLRKATQQKWRNCLNKAERQDLRVWQCEDGAEFEAFLCRHAAFVDTRGFSTSVTIALLRRLQADLVPEGRFVLLLAEHQGQPAAAVVLVRYGDTAEYLAGHVLEAGRSVNAGHLLLWRAVTWARGQGCRWFDLGGMDDVRTPQGIFHFKAGLGGVPYRLADDLDYCPARPSAWLVRWKVRRSLSDGLRP